MVNIPGWKYFLKKVTIKDIVIVILAVAVSLMWTFERQTEYIVNKLNAENERLQMENERMAHLLDLETEAL